MDGPTPLCLAIERGNDLVAEWLVDKGADVNFRGPGLTYNPSGYAQYSWPMMTAAAVEDPYFLELLLENGARINCRHEPRWSLVHGHFSMGKMTPLHLAAYSGRFENVRLLAYYGADFSKVWYDQYSPKPGWHLDRVAGQQAQPVPSDHFSDSEYSDYESETERTARTARQGVIYASSKEAKSVQDLRDALQNFDAAVQEGLFRRRLLVLCGVTRGRGSPHIPEPLLIHIMELAGLFPVVKMSEDDEKQHKAEKSILEEERRSAGRNGAVKTGRSD